MLDYERIASAFAVGRQEGFAVLDSLRVALSYAPLGISKNAELGTYGYSGGAIATGAHVGRAISIGSLIII